MPRRKLTHNRADVKAQWKLLKDMGEEPAAVRFFADGSFRLLTIKVPNLVPAATPETPNEWDVVLK